MRREVTNKNAGGSIGSAVAKEFAMEGAEVFLSGRSKSSVEAVAKAIADKGGRAHAAAIDIFDDAAVNEYLDGIVKQTGHLGRLISRASASVRGHPEIPKGNQN